MGLDQLSFIKNFITSKLIKICPTHYFLNKKIKKLTQERQRRKLETIRLRAEMHKTSKEMIRALDELERLETFNNSVFELMPSWMWAKEIIEVDGKYVSGSYIKANELIRKELFCSLDKSEIIGHDDIELAKKLRLMYGERNHTFGEPCGDSDQIVIDTKRKGVFLENGKVRGKELYVVVYKDIIFDTTGKPVCTIGTGINITEDHTILREIISSTSDSKTKDMLEKYIKRNKFESDQSIGVIL
jgi:hypothetical protein